MTALAGTLGFGTGPDPGRCCASMLEAQRRFGAGEAAVWADGRAALGRLLVPMLAEDRHDRGPVAGAGGALVLVADLRIDGRADLAAALGLAAGEADLLSDAALLMQAWERWDETTLDRLAGPFAFALWDRRRDHLVLARDPLGERPLHHGRIGKRFVFASMPTGLHGPGGIGCAVDKASLDAFLAHAPPAGTRSFFRGVERVPAGHVLTVSSAGERLRRYWRPCLDPLRLPRPDDYAEAARAHLDRAVADQSRRAEGRIGAHLSAGLDSAGVAATAARQLEAGSRLIAFTAVPPPGFAGTVPAGRFADEGPLAAATAARYGNIEHRLVSSDRPSPLADLGHGPILFQQPLPNPCNYGWAAAILEDARSMGVKVLLTGQAGNFTLSHSGTEWLAGLLARGRLLSLSGLAFDLMRGGWSLRRVAATSVGPLLRRRTAGRADDGAAQRLDALSRLDLGHFNKGILAGWGIDLRDPTADRRLVEFTLRIPSEAFLSGGIPRGLARQVLADRLPAAVLHEPRRGYQAADWAMRIDAARAEIEREVQAMLGAPDTAAPVDARRLLRLVRRWPSDWRAPGIEQAYRIDLLRALSAWRFAQAGCGGNASAEAQADSSGAHSFGAG